MPQNECVHLTWACAICVIAVALCITYSEVSLGAQKDLVARYNHQMATRYCDEPLSTHASSADERGDTGHWSDDCNEWLTTNPGKFVVFQRDVMDRLAWLASGEYAPPKCRILAKELHLVLCRVYTSKPLVV